jgi:2-polyprenyl-3-methyl-5-hydroxy-6-metoxy-1,4-benzoquinol methylase
VSGEPVVAKADIAKVDVVCNNCGENGGTTFTRGRDHEYQNTTTDTFTVVRCACGLLYLSPRPAVSELGTIYPPNYYAYNLISNRTQSRNAGDSRLARLFRARNLRRYRPTVERLHRLGRSKIHVLDIGCGDGTNLAWWREAIGGDVASHGIEMNAAAAEVAREAGNIVTTKRIEDSELPAQTFDLIYSFHVIEHVEDPSAFLSKAREALRPEGYVLIDTPNVDCVDFRLFGRSGHWGGYHFPRHFTLYDPRTFAALADKAGFEVLETTYYPAPVFWIWTLHSLLRPRAPRLADALFPPVDIMWRGTPWNVALMSVFTAVDYAAILAFGRCSQMRLLLRRKGA